MFELIYTSSRKGLLPGRSGFTTVAATRGMPPNLIAPLENLSGYNFTMQDNQFQEDLNPVCCYYIKMQYGNQILRVAGRIAPNGLDYSRRNNKIAHHLLFENADSVADFPGGAAELFESGMVFVNDFQQEPCELGVKHLPPPSEENLLPAKTWVDFSGDAGMAAWVAGKFINDPADVLYLIYPRGTEIDYLLQLIKEVCALLTEAERDNFTFNTCFGNGNASSECFLRMLPDFSPMAKNIQQLYPQKVILPGNSFIPPENDGNLCDFARTGIQPQTDENICVFAEEYAVQENDQVAPCSGHFILQTEDPETTQGENPDTAEPASPVSHRKLLLTVIALLLLIICSVGVWQITDSGSKEKQAAQIEPLPHRQMPELSVPVKFVPKPEAPEKETVSRQKETVQPPAVIPPKILPAKTGTAISGSGNYFASDSRSYSRAVKLPLQERLQMFVEFQKLRPVNSGKAVLALPGVLHKTADITVHFDCLGNQKVNCRDFLKYSGSSTVHIIAADKNSTPRSPIAGKTEDVPQLKIHLSNNRQNLHFQYIGLNPAVLLPEISRIQKFYFKTPETVYYWENGFDKEFLTVLSPGKVSLNEAGKLEYVPTEKEQQLSNFIRRDFGSSSDATLRSRSFYIAEWNSSVKQYQHQQQRQIDMQKKLSQYIESFQPALTKRECRKISKDLEKLAEQGDVQAVIREFDILLKRFFSAGTPARNTALSSDIEDLPEELAEAIFGGGIEKESADGKKFLKAEKNWRTKLLELQKFEQIKKDLEIENKKLDDCKRQLLGHAQAALATAEMIHPDIAHQMKVFMNIMPAKEFKPSAINGKQRMLLAEAITRQIRFSILDKEKLYEQDR